MSNNTRRSIRFLRTALSFALLGAVLAGALLGLVGVVARGAGAVIGGVVAAIAQCAQWCKN